MWNASEVVREVGVNDFRVAPKQQRFHLDHRVAACTLALPPIRDTLIEGFSHFVTPMTAPIASGWSVAGWGLHPLESAAFARRTPNSDICRLERTEGSKI
jgi:hypothetical protein